MTINELLKKYNLSTEKDTSKIKIIGITGSVGKSSVAYILYKYLLERNIKCEICSSIGNSTASRHGMTENRGMILQESWAAKFIHKAIEKDAEYIIFECHFIPLLYGVFSEIPMVLRTITNTYTNNFSNMRSDNEYFLAKRKLLENENGGDILLNIVDPALDVYLEGLNGDRVFYVDYGTPNLPWPRTEKFSNYDDFYNSRRASRNLPFPNYRFEFALTGIKNSFAKMNLNGTIFETWISLPLYFGTVNALHAIAMLDILGLVDIDTLDDFFSDFDNIPGRFELIDFDNKYILIDSGPFNLTKALKEWKDGNFDDILESNFSEYKDKFGGINFKTLKTIAPIMPLSEEVSNNMRREFRDLDLRTEVGYGNIGLTFNNYADYLYINPIDPGTLDMDNYFSTVYKNKIIKPYEYIYDRKEAIKKAIHELEENEILVIPGRGRRSDALYKNGIESFTDIDVVLETINSLKMEDDYNEII